ncbi:uncharacterized protein C22orf15 homolog [Caretta caretta]|uniref:uncharacterized protein C22orf15 homolog n=1 Tax=Caretta caretta TaxID=8467 RepID=UPI003F4C71D7
MLTPPPGSWRANYASLNNSLLSPRLPASLPQNTRQSEHHQQSPLARGRGTAVSRKGAAEEVWAQQSGSTMFITVRYGADCQEIVNVHCLVLTLTAHLKKKCQCRPEDCIDLLDELGTLVNLSEVENPASELASKYLEERQRYILLRVIRGEGSESTYYESLLENLGKHHPELAERLQKLSAHPQLKDNTRRSSMQRKFRPLKEPPQGSPAKFRSTQQSKKGSVPSSRPT